MMFERFQRLAERLHGYPWWQVAVELLLIWLAVFMVFRFIQGTRAAGALKGTLFIIILATLVVRILGQQEAFQRIKFLYDTFLTLLAITLIVVFQPELRRGLIRLGETPILRRSHRGGSSVIDGLVEAAAYLSKQSFGALIVVEREGSLKGITDGGTVIHGQVSARLLQTIFFPGSALHDLAVVVRGGEVVAAGVQLPLADPADMPDPALGSRHRAAVGLSKESDALVIVVSEESGAISVAEKGRLVRGLSVEELRDLLWKRLRTVVRPVGGAGGVGGGGGGVRAGVGNGSGNGDSMAGDSVAGMVVGSGDSGMGMASPAPSAASSSATAAARRLAAGKTAANDQARRRSIKGEG